MPITTPADAVEQYRGDSDHFGHVLEHLFVPALENAGYEPIKPSAQGADLIQAEIISNLERADLVLCDISLLNPNVFFELGIRTALDRAVCLVRDDQTRRIPFDTGVLNFHTYHSGLQPWRLAQEVEALAEHIRQSAERASGRNALWRYFGLTQRGTEAINAAPTDPQASQLELILDEIRNLRGASRSGTGTYDREEDFLGSPDFRHVLREAMELAGAKTARHTYDPDRNVLFLRLGTRPLTADEKREVRKLVEPLGVRVEFGSIG